VTTRALIQRINRKLAGDDMQLKKTKRRNAVRAPKGRRVFSGPWENLHDFSLIEPIAIHDSKLGFRLTG
jgi:hypothetical protein